MSELFQEFKGLQPTYQSVLNLCLATIVNAINDGDTERAFRGVKTLIVISPPKVQKECLPDLNRIEAAIRRVLRMTGVDLYQTRVLHSQHIDKILRRETLPLFHKVMTLLHESGYLEKVKTVRKGRFEG
jgi:hypothetical protein